jgi:HD-GYP domain-containing protein (c-di-GMP phosphodiesterase class II)
MPVMLVEIPESMNEYFKKIVPSGTEMIVRAINDNVLDEKLNGFDIVITFDKDAVIASKKLCERALRFPNVGFIYYSQVSLDKNKEYSVENLLLQNMNDLNLKDSSQITALLNNGLFFLETLKHFRTCNRNLQERLTELNKIGIALSSERNLDKLLDMILKEVRKFTRSDAGSLYIKDGDELVFKMAQNDTIDRQSGREREFKQLRIPISTKSLAGYVAQTLKPLNIMDVSDILKDSPFQHDTSFDQKFGYKTKSILTFPMKDTKGELVGVLQLINALDENCEPIPFNKTVESLVESMGSQAAVAIKNAALLDDINKLLMSLIEYSSALIDARSRHTSGHSKRVAHLVIEIAMLINRSNDPPFEKTKFNRDEMQELYFSALLHDIGKIGVPEAILDKKSRITDQGIEAIFWKIKMLSKEIEEEVNNKGRFLFCEQAIDLNNLNDIEKKLGNLWDEIKKINDTNVLSDEAEERVKQFSKAKIKADNSEVELLTSEELQNILIKNGNLTDIEREIIKNHINLTIDTLERIPFPRHLAGVPFFAGQHHEKLDGSGYPRGLKGDQIPLQSRILTIADYIDALSAQDRPYRKGLPLSQSISILVRDAEKGLLDIDIVKLFKENVEKGKLQIPWYIL